MTNSDKIKKILALRLIAMAKGLVAKLEHEPNFLPPRDDLKVRYREEDISRDDRDDYKDTLFDDDLKDEPLK